MFWYVYQLPIPLCAAFIFIFMLAWVVITFKLGVGRQRAWRLCNFCFFVIYALVIIYGTLILRGETDTDLHLQPFRLIILAQSVPEAYRSMFMNVALFIPFGLTLSYSFGNRFPLGRTVLICTLSGLLLSTAVEAAQYVFSRGIAEVDDVICNSLGAFIGALPLCLQKHYNKAMDSETKKDSYESFLFF